MDIGDLGQYTDAIACLRQTLQEGRKSSNVDIYLMLANVQRCETIVQQLLLSEKDAFYSTALTSLAGSLTAHASVLHRKIQHLEEQANTVDTSSSAVSQTRLLDKRSGVDSPSSKTKFPQYCNSVADSSADTSAGSKTSEDDSCSNESKQTKFRQSVVETTIMSNGSLKFSDVIGLEEAKQALRDAILLPAVFPQLFSGGRKPWKRILLFGPPGTGKSRLAQAVSSEVHATFYSVSSTDLMSSWVGETEKLIKELFHHASKQSGQSVIFIDEIDSLCRKRTSREDEGSRRIKTELLIQMDGVETPGQDKILLMCATNCPWDLDTAFLRRFQKRIYIPLPDKLSRIRLLQLHCKGSLVNMTSSDWDLLAQSTDGYSGSDLSTLTLGALLQPVRDLQTAIHWRLTNGGKLIPCDPMVKDALRAKMTDLPTNKISPRAVTLDDFLKSLRLHRATVSPNELSRFQEFTSSYGQTG